jgi:hypothetical protein
MTTNVIWFACPSCMWWERSCGSRSNRGQEKSNAGETHLEMIVILSWTVKRVTDEKALRERKKGLSKLDGNGKLYIHHHTTCEYGRSEIHTRKHQDNLKRS